MSGTSEPGARRWTAGLSLFGEVVITGAFVLLLALPVVTALPALAAGTSHLRRHVTGESVRVRDAFGDFAVAWRELWRLALGLTGVALLLLWNLSLGQADVLPGAGGVVAVSTLLLVAWAVLLLRLAVAWRPAGETADATDLPDAGDTADAADAVRGGSPWRPELLREAADRLWRDPAGSLLLVVACGMCVVFVWMLLPLLLLCGGLLCLATLGVSLRQARAA
ncbi:hypothetical protein ACTWP5_31045 [Streptomyces sp. 4N509B]|uniref:hypothetical protein n=1 Tax=Streptomyces sp. 4N509B TaxID=3457413 RepID=UPI003FD26B01